jgi:hydrogenase 3 maturation protease
MEKEDLVQLFKGKVVFLGIGNPLRGDDGFGPALIQGLEGRVRAACLDAGTAPESYAGKVIKENPDTIVLVDAVHLGLAPGECAILNKADILKTGFTTHDLSPALFMQYLESQTTAGIYLLGVQPETVALGAEMSASVIRALTDMIAMIKDILVPQVQLIDAVIKGIVEHAGKEGARKVKSIRFKLGQFLGIKDDAFRETFTALAKGTMLEGASLEIVPFLSFRIDVVSFDIE